MKQFFSRDSKKVSKKGIAKEETLRARYTEYKGSRENLDAPVYKKHVNDLHTVSNIILSTLWRFLFKWTFCLKRTTK